MIFRQFLLLILTSVCIQLSECCAVTPPVHTTIVTIRRVSEGDDYLMFGTLFRGNIVVTTPHYLVGADVKDVFVEANCEKITKKMNLSNSCIRRKASKIILHDDLNSTQNFMDSIAVVMLKTSFFIGINTIELTRFGEDLDTLIIPKCVHAKPYYSQDLDEVIFYHGSFHKEAIDYQAKIGKTALISKSTFSNLIFPELKNKTSMYEYISEQYHNVQISHDTDEQYLGTPILCPHLLNPRMYFQVGIANYFFLMNYKIRNQDQSKKLLYYIDLVARDWEILRIVSRAFTFDEIQIQHER